MKKKLDCPNCEDKAILETEPLKLKYKNKIHHILLYVYKCRTCKTRFTTTESDTKTINQVKKNGK